VLQESLRPWMWVLGVVVVLLAGMLYYDHWSRCSGKPYERADALRNATSFLQSLSRDFSLGDPPPSLVEEQYDSARATWMFTFRNATCTLDIITDRCKGTEVGGMTKGCTGRRAH
jgi:hypothetical protein